MFCLKYIAKTVRKILSSNMNKQNGKQFRLFRLQKYLFLAL